MSDLVGTQIVGFLMHMLIIPIFWCDVEQERNFHVLIELHREKTGFCLCENKGTDQLRSNCEADQSLCFRYSDSTIPLLLIAKISSI